MVLTRSTAVSSGLLRTSTDGSRLPCGSNTRVTGPTPVVGSGTVGLSAGEAATAMAAVAPPWVGSAPPTIAPGSLRWLPTTSPLVATYLNRPTSPGPETSSTASRAASGAPDVFT